MKTDTYNIHSAKKYHIHQNYVSNSSVVGCLCKMLEEVALYDRSRFSGTGVILLEDIHTIDYLGMFSETAHWRNDDVTDTLKRISSRNSAYHDGFHLLDSKLQPIQYCAYVCPSIDFNRIRTRKNNVGGSRSYTALLSSMMDGVLCSAIAHYEGEIRLFVDGKELSPSSYYADRTAAVTREIGLIKPVYLS